MCDSPSSCPTCVSGADLYLKLPKTVSRQTLAGRRSRIRALLLLQQADGVEEDDENGYRCNVTHESLPGGIENGIGNFELSLGAIG